MARHKKSFWTVLADSLSPQETKPRTVPSIRPQQAARDHARVVLGEIASVRDFETWKRASTSVYAIVHFEDENDHVMAPYINDLCLNLRDAGERLALTHPELAPFIQAALREIANRLGGEAQPAVGPKRGEAIFEGTDYPRTWDAFIGQEEAKDQLRVQIASAQARGKRVEHTLIASGVPGVGKSTLATLLAYHAGVGLERVSGQVSASDFLALARNMQDRDILFIDEVHTLVASGRNKADWLLPFMTEGVVYTEQGVERVPDVAIVAATTDAGLLPDALLSRFMVQPPILPYTPAEGTQIASQTAARLGVVIDEHTALRVALAAAYNPRTTRRLLISIRDLGHAYPDTFPNFERALQWNGLSADGLTNTAVRILKILQDAPNNTCGEKALMSQLGESSPIRQHEQILLQRGLVAQTPKGRTLTEAGHERLLQESMR